MGETSVPKKRRGRNHGLKGTAEYIVWEGMRARCSNPNHISYIYYGDKGIRVCERWDSFENFLEDMGSRPSDKHIIERRDSAEGYCPENCYWSEDKSFQSFNISLRKDNLSGKTGVYLEKSSGKWVSEISINGKSKKLGRFSSKEQAIERRQQAELEFYGMTKQ